MRRLLVRQTVFRDLSDHRLLSYVARSSVSYGNFEARDEPVFQFSGTNDETCPGCRTLF